MRTKLAIVLFVVLMAPASARGAVSWVVTGHGFGHGVGMSQYGAYGYAKHGKGYRFILDHYYRGTTIGKLSGSKVVRVLLDVVGGDVGFSEARGACGQRLDPAREYEAHRSGPRIKLRTAAGRTIADCGGVLRAFGAGRVEVSGIGAYRGALEVVPTDSDAGSLNAINAVAVDQYVKGVIPNESPASWPQAALRAQAIAARSYALTVQVAGNGFDLYDTVSSQVYEGLDSETAATNTAATATKGEVVLYQGKIAETYFSACSGGHTESVQNVFFGSAVPYLVGVPDPYDYYCPLHTWTLRFSGPEISAKLSGYLEGRLKRVEVTRRGTSPRIMWARLVGTGGNSMIRGDQLAAALGGYDRWLSFHKVADRQAVKGVHAESPSAAAIADGNGGHALPAGGGGEPGGTGSHGGGDFID